MSATQTTLDWLRDEITSCTEDSIRNAAGDEGRELAGRARVLSQVKRRLVAEHVAVSGALVDVRNALLSVADGSMDAAAREVCEWCAQTLAEVRL